MNISGTTRKDYLCFSVLSLSIFQNYILKQCNVELLQVALTTLPQDVEDQCSILAKTSVYTELGRLCCQRKQFDEAEKFYLKSNYAVLEFFKTHSEAFSMQVIRIIGDLERIFGRF